MFSIIGILVVFGAVVGGYLMEHGNLMVLLQPAELVIIGGAAGGTMLGCQSACTFSRKSWAASLRVFKGTKYGRQRYLDTLKMLYDLFNRPGAMGWWRSKADIEDPTRARFFPRTSEFLADHHVRDFVCDTLRMAITGGSGTVRPRPDDRERHGGAPSRGTEPIAALSTMADSLPGLGIVAAVLGVVITMGALGGPPEEIGHKVAAALVGTFLGILLCYGLIGPLAQNMAKAADEEHAYYQVLRVAMIGFIKGLSPVLAMEMARRSIPGSGAAIVPWKWKAFAAAGGAAQAPAQAA